ncbi:MAG TPA: NAD(P)H-hydrate epimerase [Gemmatales bacterium]|nr:NAD(P)H-hydrate epimerase [Gemmatales bacterium]HMP16460.1 NAD(P)H-hydrate epimerase [Gemmatales bacterium]
MSLTREQVREIDRQAIEVLGIPGVVLMENAGRSVFEVLQSLPYDDPIHIICGKGNNGGDGYVVARHLYLAGRKVVVHRCGAEREITGDAGIMYQIISRLSIPLLGWSTAEKLATELRSARLIVDALLGTGLTGEVRSPLAEIIQVMNQSGKPILAVDIPSGLDANTGQPLGGAVVAQHTVTFVDKKIGMLNDEAWLYTGEIHVAGIGAPATLLPV